MSVIATVLWQGFAGTKMEKGLLSAPCCWVFTISLESCSTSECAQVSRDQSDRSWLNSSYCIDREHLLIIPGVLSAEKDSACREGKAVGVKARICHGNRCVQNSSSRSPTNTCREPASVTWLI